MKSQLYYSLGCVSCDAASKSQEAYYLVYVANLM